MNITMAGIDYTTAPVESRELFATSGDKTKEILKSVYRMDGIGGCVVLSTCSRTEIYLSTSFPVNPARILCKLMDCSFTLYGSFFTIRKGLDAVRHLMLLGSGLKSLILGEDQILSQVKEVLSLAREAETTDPYLETLFGKAVAAGKKVKTECRIVQVPESAPDKVVSFLYENGYPLEEWQATVIGNGEIGRKMATLFGGRCRKTVVTLREYKKGEVIIPAGCETVPYSERYTELNKSQIVVSATKSPHFTVTRKKAAILNRLPLLFIDLAMPRDIESGLETLGTRVMNVDDFGSRTDINRTAKTKAEAIIEEYIRKWEKWKQYKERLNGGIMPLGSSM